MHTTKSVLYLGFGADADPCVADAVRAAGRELVEAATVDEAARLYGGRDVNLLLIKDDPRAGKLWDVIGALRGGTTGLRTPVIVLTGPAGLSHPPSGEDLIDVLPAPFVQAHLESRIRYNLNIQRILDTAEERALKLASIVEISEAINQTLDAGQILYNIARKLSEVMDLVRCSFILPDLEKNRGEVLACKDDPNIHNLQIDLRNYPEILKVLETGRFVMIEDVAHDPIMADVLDLTRLIVDQSILTMPLAFKGSVIGILQVRKKGLPKGFSAREVDFCQLIANAAAIALTNAQLVEDIEKRNETLTEQKGELETLSAELKATNAELVALQRTKEEFVAMMVHDLRSPMTIIQGVLEILDSTDPSPEQKKGLLRDALDETNRILDMIQNLLEISRLERGEIDLDLEPVDLGALLRETAQPFRTLVDKRGIELAVNIDEDLPVFLGDESRLRQVFTNLLTNGLEHTPDKGKITMSGSRARPNGREMLKITVEDNGCGIPQDLLPNIFEKFVRHQPENRESTAHHGTGLGLAIVKLFTEAHGGTAQVQSTVGKGSIFTIHLPVSRT